MSTEHGVIDQRVGLLGATGLVVGNVIGIAIFVLAAPLAADAGPSVVLAMLLAGVPLVFSLLTILQLGGAIPVAGGTYVYGSRLVAPFWGFATPWMVVPGVWAGLLFTANGFAEYVGYFLPIPQEGLMYAILLAFLLINVVGIRVVAWLQMAMVAVLVAGILAFVVPGAFYVDAGNFTPPLPNGVGPFVVAVVSLHFPLRGFSMVIEIGEEIENPAENIPRVLVLSAAIGLTLMVALLAVFVGVAGWRGVDDLDAAVAAVAGQFLPAPLVGLVVAAALLGSLTSVNTTFASYSRTIMRAARDDVIPEAFAALGDRFDTPHRSVLLLGVPPVLLVPVTPSPVVLSISLSLAILFAVFVGGLALWNLPKLFPQRYEYSLYRLPLPLLRVTAVGSVLSAVLLWVALLTELPWIGAVVFGWLCLGWVVFRLRVRRFRQAGVDLPERMRRLHDHES
ncbi:amino acid permease [Natronomonas sp. CBA1123]|jgi:APA family basic amino acid/polyamine antiporter|uniref:APC family permease n=1 Tax=Natronomonas sp. CBA1123 TaxID=2668070 RepID=UPI0012EA6B76|nr:APC family permease [Natronomonas sp. CBA1123]MUV85819.1 amino acid permease [Natronomonas sp. CBA1123]